VRLFRSPKSLLTLAALVLLALIVLAGREAVLRRRAYRLPDAAVNLAPEKVKELQQKIVENEAAVKKNADDFSAYTNLALAKTELGDRDGAAEVYRTMNQRFPGNYLSFQNLGKLYEDAGKYAFAAEQYLLAIDNAPKIPHLYRNLVNLYTYQYPERASDIPRVLQKGLGIMPGSVDLMSMMAVYYRDHGQPEEAIKWYEQLLVFDQENQAALEELKQLKEKAK
jgi:tetratricopeptide (TPR) repeat protein